MHPTTPVSHKFGKLSLTIINSYLVDVSSTSGAQPGDCPCSYTILLIHLCPNVTVYLCFGRQLRWFCEKKLTKRIIFYCHDEALKVFRKYRCHPVYCMYLTCTVCSRRVLIHDGEFCNGCVTKRCLNNLFRNWSMIKQESYKGYCAFVIFVIKLVSLWSESL